MSTGWRTRPLGTPVRWLAAGLRSAATLVETVVPDSRPEPSRGRDDAPTPMPLLPDAAPSRPHATTAPAPAADARTSRAESTVAARLSPAPADPMPEKCLHLLPRTPRTAFAFWNLPASCLDEVSAPLATETATSALRIRTDFPDATQRLVRLAPGAQCHYLTALPEGNTVSVCLGVVSQQSFVPLTADQRIHLPPAAPDHHRKCDEYAPDNGAADAATVKTPRGNSSSS